MDSEQTRLSVANFIEDENRVTVLEGKVPEEHSGTLTNTELIDLNDRIAILEGLEPTGKITLSNMLYMDDKIEELEEKQDDVTLTYNVNGGTGSIDSVTVDAGTQVVLDDGSSITPPTNKHFIGWGTTDSAIEVVSSPITLIANTTLYAVYEYNYATFTYDGNGGKVLGEDTYSTEYQIGSEITLILTGNDVTAPEGKVFYGWSNDPTNYVQVEEPILIEENTGVYAFYEDATYTVYYNGNGGTVLGDQVHEESYNAGVIELLDGNSSVTAPTGKEFVGWGESSDTDPSQVLPQYITLSADKTLYAIYQSSGVTLTLDYNGALTRAGTTADVHNLNPGDTFVDRYGYTTENHFMDLNLPITENVNVFKFFTSTKDDPSTAVTLTSPGITVNEDTTLYAYWDNTHAWVQTMCNKQGVSLQFEGGEVLPSLMFTQVASDGTAPRLNIINNQAMDDWYISYGDMWNTVSLSQFNQAHPGFYNGSYFDFSVLGNQMKNISILTRSTNIPVGADIHEITGM